MVRYVYPKFNSYQPNGPGIHNNGAPVGYHNIEGVKLVYLEPGDGHVIFDETLFDVPAHLAGNFPTNHPPHVMIIGTDGDDKVSFKPTDPNWTNTIGPTGGAVNNAPRIHFRTGWGNDELLIYHDEHAAANSSIKQISLSQSLGHKPEPGRYDSTTYTYVPGYNPYLTGPQYGNPSPIANGAWDPSQKIMEGVSRSDFGDFSVNQAVNPNSKLTFVTNETRDQYVGNHAANGNAQDPGTWTANGYTYKGEADILDFTLNGVKQDVVPGATNAGFHYRLFNWAGGPGSINIQPPAAPCFTRGTRIETDRGDVRVEDLQAGDMLKTLSGGYRPLRWVGSRKIDRYRMEVEKGLRPVRILANTFGGHDELVVSPQHRMCIETGAGDLLFDGEPILASAKSLVNGHSVTYAYDLDSVEYFHLLLDEHEVIYANGAMAETLLLSDGLMSAEAIAELRSIFSEEQLEEMMSVPAYGRVAKAYEAAVLTEMMQTNHEAAQ